MRATALRIIKPQFEALEASVTSIASNNETANRVFL
ncbi:hypothetical protein EVA_14767 [gut metagenome]|uniref:Uncharacterized protein n=1 Tax=gut metagenome TaxID=749906 RepID=J9GCL0_9ZZZZ